jgi:hypothetical protein
VERIQYLLLNLNPHDQIGKSQGLTLWFLTEYGTNVAGALTEESINKRVLPFVSSKKIETVKRTSAVIGEVVKRTVGD